MAKKQGDEDEDFLLPGDEEEGQDEEVEVEEDEDEEDESEDGEDEEEGQDEEDEEESAGNSEAIEFVRENLDHENPDVAAFARTILALSDGDAGEGLIEFVGKDEEMHITSSDFICHCGQEHE